MSLIVRSCPVNEHAYNRQSLEYFMGIRALILDEEKNNLNDNYSVLISLLKTLSTMDVS